MSSSVTVLVMGTNSGKSRCVDVSLPQNQVETSNGVSTGKPSNQRLMQYGSGSEHGQVDDECNRRNQAGRHGGVRRRNALEAEAKYTTIDQNAWRHNALAAQRHTTDNALALLLANRQWATMTLLTMNCHAL